MWAIVFIHKTGGSKSVTDIDLASVYTKADRVSKAFPGSYLVATCPFEVSFSSLFPGMECTIPNTSIPPEVYAVWEADLIAKYKDKEIYHE